jgi:hypothetical protein
MIFAILQRLRPTRLTLTTLIGLLWAVTFGGIRDFVWADLKEGSISLKGLSLSVRGLVILGFALLFAMIGVLLFNDLWRGLFPLLPALNGVTGRGSLVPAALLPLTLFMFTLAWSFALVGALYSHWAVRLGVLILYLGTGTLWSLSLFASVTLSSSLMWGGLALLGMGGIVVIFAVSRWIKPPPALAFPLLLGAVALTHVVAQFQSVTDLRMTGIPLVLGNIGVTLAVLQILILPLLFLIGLDIADFVRQAARWPIEILRERLPGYLLLIALPFLLGWRLWIVFADLWGQLQTAPLETVLPPYLGALGVPLWVGVLWFLTSRGGHPDGEGINRAVARWALIIILGYYVVQSVDGYAPGPDLLLLVSPMAILGGLVLAWRGHRPLGLYLSLVGAIHLWSLLTELDAPLRWFYWDRPVMVEFWWVVIFALTALWWGLRGRLDVERAGNLLFLLLILILLRQTDFIENPFSPFFAFAGIGFIAFGIAWDVLTAGSWANVSTPGLPRISRIFLYLGYVLITVTVINWALTAHDLNTIEQFTGGVAMAGLTRFGRPFLYAIFAVTLAGRERERGREGERERGREGEIRRLNVWIFLAS